MTDSNKLNVEFLNPNQCIFSFNANGFLTFNYCNEHKGRVKLIRAYPFSLENEYICVRDLDDNELGIIRELAALDGTSAENARKELQTRYYCPTVTAVKRIKERMGNFYFDTIIDGKPKSFTVRDITKNMRFANDGVLLIFDMDGNRYIIPDFESIEDKSKRLLEPYLY